jgi:beta-glucosidase
VGTKVGFAENMGVAVPVIDAPDYVKAAQAATRGINAGFITVMPEDNYTDAFLAEAGGSTPRFDDDEMKIIASPLDFVGINVYKPRCFPEPADEPPGYREIPINASHPKMQSAWHVLDPAVMYWAPKQVQAIRASKSIFITESGCAKAVGPRRRAGWLPGCLCVSSSDGLEGDSDD